MFVMTTELPILRENDKQNEDTSKLKAEIKELKDHNTSEDQKLSFGVA